MILRYRNLFQIFTITLSLALMITTLAVETVQAKETQPATISVSGTGKASIAPDLALISFGVIREGKTARDALNANNKAMGDVLKAMMERGIADKDLQTSNFNISPRYFYPPRKNNETQKSPKIVGYTVSNTLSVRVRDLNKTGELLDLVVSLGVNSGGSIQFTNDNPEAILEQARINAVKNAVRKAEILTSTAGVKLGRIINISEQSTTPRPHSFAQKALRAEAVSDAVPIASGENSYQINVQISWEIEQ